MSPLTDLFVRLLFITGVPTRRELRLVVARFAPSSLCLLCPSSLV